MDSLNSLTSNTTSKVNRLSADELQEIAESIAVWIDARGTISLQTAIHSWQETIGHCWLEKINGKEKHYALTK